MERVTTWLGGLTAALACSACLGDPPQLPPPPAGSDSSDTGRPATDSGGSTAGLDGTTRGGASVDSSVDDAPPEATTGMVDPGDCCAPQMGPGCSAEDVQECVCQLEPYCCDEVWDEQCASQVENLGCGSCGTTTPTCCEPHGGCEDEGVAECVCSNFPSCCSDDWSLYCVTVAATECGQTCAPIEGRCCEPGEQFGCDSYEVVRCVCDVIPECCSMTWGGACVQTAIDQCTMC